MPRTRIVCTIGPATMASTMLEELIKAGMNVARLKFSHGTYAERERTIRDIRTISSRLGCPVAILQDLAGTQPGTDWA